MNLQPSLRRTLASIGTLILLLVARAQADDAPAINAAILTALNNEQPSYTLPAVVHISSRIVIPTESEAGITSDFTLKGATGGTKIYADVPVSGMITLGNEVTSPNDVFTGVGLPSASILPVTMGSTTFVVNILQPDPIVGTFHTLVDSQKENTNQTNVNAELVRIIAFNWLTRVATVDRPIGRSFTINPMLRDVNMRVTRNITLRDIELYGGSSSYGSMGGFNCSMVAGLNLVNVKTKYFKTDNIRLDICRDVTIDGFDNRFYVYGDVAGWGRGVSLFWCKDVTIANGYSESLRHGISMIAASSDVLVRDCVGNDVIGNSFDIHGMLSYRVTFLRCTGSGQMQVGNGTFYTGDRNTTIRDCNLSSGIVIVGDCRNTSIYNTHARYIQLQSWGTSSTDFRPKDTYAEFSTFIDSDPVTGPVMFAGSPWKSFQNLTFVACDFRELNGPGQRAFLLEDPKGNLGLIKFIGTRFSTKNAAGTGYSRPVEISGPNSNATLILEMRACALETDGTTWLQFGPGLVGSGLISGWLPPAGGMAQPIVNGSGSTFPITLIGGGRFPGSGGVGAPPP